MPCILVVDDNDEHVELVNRILTARGYTVVAAGDAETGLQAAVDHDPDLILLDLGLPDVDGQTLVGLMRRVPELTHTPIIAVTAWPQETAREMVEAYGCAGYISKPIVRITDLVDQVASHLRR
ncbi:MAG TPA: response regulator [Anaerolineae bacterium]|nr:response regulator [Anaerolineae bacterium]